MNYDNKVNYSDINDLIKNANKVGYKVTIIINGEYYNIQPASIPGIDKQKDI